MSTLLLSVIMAAMLSVDGICASTDTTDIYFINGVSVSNFDGSQIEGHKVESYKISIRKETGNRVMRMHEIELETPQKDSVIYFVNRRSVSMDKAKEMLMNGNVGNISLYINPESGRRVLRIMTKDEIERQEQFKKNFQKRFK